MKSVLQCNQHQSVFIPMTIEVSGGTPTIGEGTSFATVADTGTGIFTVTFNDGFGRAPVVVATPEAATGVELFCIVRDRTAAGFVVECTDEAGTLTDPVAINLHIWGSYSSDEA